MPKHTGDDANHLIARVVVPHPPGFATPFSRVPTFPITKPATSSLEELLDRIVPFRRETTEQQAETVDYAAPVQAFDVEQW